MGKHRVLAHRGGEEQDRGDGLLTLFRRRVMVLRGWHNTCLDDCKLGATGDLGTI